MKKNKYIYTGYEWTFDIVEDLWSVIDDIAKNKYGLDYYEPQLEVVTSEQMIANHAHHAMPIMYNHWSFGKNYSKILEDYQQGKTSIAYETIINTNPTIAYILEDNTATMQSIVLAHAVCGHGSFFKNNYLFKQWTDPDAIIDYLDFAKNYVTQCEQKYGASEVERILDAAHALMYYGIDKYKRSRNSILKASEEKERLRRLNEEEYSNEIWKTIPGWDKKLNPGKPKKIEFPEENLLYFIEKRSPKLKPWQKELVRIVRKISQYFYPQIQTKVMNEGWASFWHHTLMTDLYDEGYITEGAYLEFLKSHSDVVYQREHSRFNPYALGFSMFKDIQRICENPTEEDKKYLPDVAGQEWLPLLKDIMYNYRDESFIRQFLSPKLVKDLQIFSIQSKYEEDHYLVEAIQNEKDFYQVRKNLADEYTWSNILPDIEITEFHDIVDRSLHLRHNPYKNRKLNPQDTRQTLRCLRTLWGFPVYLYTIDSEGQPLIYKREY